jgi:hypothetical protein
MQRISFKPFIPHLVAVGVFLLVSVIFCKPALESGVVMQQSDVTAVQSMKHQSEVYFEKKGVYPLWITSMFSGMPAYNIIFSGPTSPFQYINQAFQLWLPKPLNFFFLSCICFYIFCLCIRVKPYAGIFASLAFAYATYNPILAAAGHDTKLLALAYAPALLGSILLLFDKKYIAGFVLTALFANLHLMQNHQQISYYLLLVIAIMSIFFLVRWAREKELLHGAKAISLALAAGILGVMINAIILFPVYDFAKYSKRGGQLILKDRTGKDAPKTSDSKTTGLSRDYAFQWSNDKTESLSILFPSVNGYGFHYGQRDGEFDMFPQLDENSHVATYLTEKLNMPEAQTSELLGNFSQKIYWGGKPFTTGPAYLGAVICALVILGMFILDGKHKWWMFTASIFGLLLGMGKNFPGLNDFLFDHLPLYNKFRTPEMALVIPQLLFPALAVMTVNRMLEGSTALMPKFKWGAITTGIVFLLAAVLYFSFDYAKENKQRTLAFTNAMAAKDSTTQGKLDSINEKYEALSDNRTYEEILYQTKGDAQLAKGILNSLREDRKAIFGKDILRGLLFSLITLGLVWLFLSGKMKASLLISGLSVLVLADLLPLGMHYVNEKSFDAEEKYQANQFSPTAADNSILADKDPNYRVFDISGGDPFQDSKPSYFHKSIGGYHPAKIGIYDDLATYQLSGRFNPAVLNMLNTKYLIQKSSDGKNTVAIPNPDALGNCWFVKGVKYVNGPAEEMTALDNFSPKDTAVADKSFTGAIGNFQPADSNARIRQTAFDNEAISYQSENSNPGLALFSEVFYKDWNAYVDGKQVPVAKVNYVLRGINVPAGSHKIDFKFEPAVYRLSYRISLISMWLLMALLGWFLFHSYRKATAKE